MIIIRILWGFIQKCIHAFQISINPWLVPLTACHSCVTANSFWINHSDIKLIALLALWEKQRRWVSCFNSPSVPRFLSAITLICERTPHPVAHSSPAPFTRQTNCWVLGWTLVYAHMDFHAWADSRWWIKELQASLRPSRFRRGGRSSTVLKVYCSSRWPSTIYCAFKHLCDNMPSLTYLPSAQHCKSSWRTNSHCSCEHALMAGRCISRAFSGRWRYYLRCAH